MLEFKTAEMIRREKVSKQCKQDIKARLNDIAHIIDKKLTLQHSADLTHILDSLDDLVDGYSHLLPQG